MVDDVKVMKKYIIVPENGFQAFVERKYIEIRKVALNDVADVAYNKGLPIQYYRYEKPFVFEYS